MDVLRSQELEIFVGVRLRSDVDMGIKLGEMLQRRARLCPGQRAGREKKQWEGAVRHA